MLPETTLNQASRTVAKGEEPDSSASPEKLLLALLSTSLRPYLYKLNYN